jgi:hypothetical protein
LKEKERNEFPKAGRVCKGCCVIWQREYRRKTRELFLAAYPLQPKPILTHKVCTMCGEDKPIDEYNFSSKTKNIRSTYCKPCQGKRSYADFQRRNNPDEKLRYRCSQFGTTVEWYKAKFAEQDGKCALCHMEETHPIRKGGKPRTLAIDHDHESGKPRGLLCFRCNTAMERFESHGAGWLDSAVAYLHRE